MKWRRSKWIHWIQELNFQKYMDSYKRWIHQKNSWKQWIHLNDEKPPNDRNMWIHLKGEFIKIKSWKQWIHLNDETWRNMPTIRKSTVNHGKQESAILGYWKKPLKTMWDTWSSIMSHITFICPQYESQQWTMESKKAPYWGIEKNR